MRVEIPGGASVHLGTTETAPTISVVDYSRRETDDFGVTTVVERGFSRRMSVRLAVPFDQVDAIQSQLAALRATPALWVADDMLDSLAIEGFYKDFSIDLAVPPVSFCTLTIEGLAESSAWSDSGGDVAPDARASSLLLLQPIDVTGAMLTASNVPETDYAEWAAGTTYALGARVIKAATHRIYESAAAGNIGHDPAGTSGHWIEVGATNRWAMFDQALGSVTERAGSIVVTVDPADLIEAVALLDVTGASVRVQATGYDRTIAPVRQPGMASFLDMPLSGGPVTVTITGSGTVSVGTMLLGRSRGLGVTEASPTAAITDYSRKETDEFGDVTVVERAWAKRMSVGALIRTDAIDLVAGRIASVRARPSLWIGNDGTEAVTIYGFFKEFSIEVGEAVSRLTLSVEGLSKAAKIAPLDFSVDWPDIGDPDGTKPENGADVTANNVSADTAAIAGKAAALVLAELTAAGVIGINNEFWIRRRETIDPVTGLVAVTEYANSDGVIVSRSMAAGPDGGVIGYMASEYLFTDNSGGNIRPIMTYDDGRWKIWDAWINKLEIGSVLTGSIAPNAVVDGDTISLAAPLTGNGSWQTAFEYELAIPAPVAGELVEWQVVAIVTGSQSFPSGDRTWNTRLIFEAEQKGAAGGQKSEDSLAMSGRVNWGTGTRPIKVEWNGASGCSLAEMNMTLLWFKR